MTDIQRVESLDATPKILLNGHQQAQNPLPISDSLVAADFDYNSLVTEDDEPVDHIFSEKQQHLLTETLYTSCARLPLTWPFLVLANVGLHHHPQQPAIVPDILLSLGVQPAEDV